MATLFTLSIQDADGDKSSVGYYVDSSVITSLDDVNTIAQRLWIFVAPLVTGQLVGISVNIAVDITDYTNNAFSALSDVQEKVQFHTVHQGQTRGQSNQHTIPTVKETIFFANGAGKFVDHSNSDVAAYQTALESAFSSGGLSIMNEHDEPILELVAGYQYWGNRRILR